MYKCIIRITNSRWVFFLFNYKNQIIVFRKLYTLFYSSTCTFVYSSTLDSGRRATSTRSSSPVNGWPADQPRLHFIPESTYMAEAKSDCVPTEGRGDSTCYSWTERKFTVVGCSQTEIYCLKLWTNPSSCKKE